MALEIIGGAGPVANHINTYGVLSDDVTGWTIVTSPAPSDGTWRIKAVEGANADLDLLPSDSFAAKVFQWWSCRDFRFGGTVVSGDEIPFLLLGGGVGVIYYFGVKYATASTYHFVVWEANIGAGTNTDVLVSSSTFTAGGSPVDYAVRLEVSKDAPNLWRLWVDGTNEGEYAGTGGSITNRSSCILLNGATITDFNRLGSGQEMFFNGLLWSQSDDENDRPDTDVEVDRLDSDGDTADDDFGDHNDCSNDGAATHTNWAPSSDAPDESTYNCRGAKNELQISTLTSVTPSVALVGAIYRNWRRSNDTVKVVNNWARLVNGSDRTETVEVQLSDPQTTSFESDAAVFSVPPSGNFPWIITDVSSLQAGSRVVNTNTANIEIAMQFVELFSVSNDPPPASEQIERRGAGQLI